MQYYIGYAHLGVKTTFFKLYADENKHRPGTSGKERFCFY